MLLLSDKLMRCCAAGANGSLDLRHRAFALDGLVSADGTDVQAAWQVVLKTVWLPCDEAQQVGCLRELEGCPHVLDAGIQFNS